MNENTNIRKDGLSGLIRTRNEAPLLAPCIDSCIEALDELVVVCSDCTDNTIEILEKKRQQYPDKLRYYEYNHKVLSFDLTDEEFEYAKNLPDDSPRLYANLCNFGLSKTHYKYVTKIDADQLYFADELKKWRDVCSGNVRMKWSIRFVLGWFFMMYFSVYRRLSLKCGKPCLRMLPDWFVKLFFKHYSDYSKWLLQRGKVLIALSGVNVFKDDRWYVTFDGVNIHPPYNGEGDTVIFKFSDQTYWCRYYTNRIPHSVTEVFNSPCRKLMFTRPVWFHLHANRERFWRNVKKMKDEHPECFVPVEEFPSMSYEEVYRKMDKNAHTLFQTTLFAIVHKMGKQLVLKHIRLLKR